MLSFLETAHTHTNRKWAMGAPIERREWPGIAGGNYKYFRIQFPFFANCQVDNSNRASLASRCPHPSSFILHPLSFILLILILISSSCAAALKFTHHKLKSPAPVHVIKRKLIAHLLFRRSVGVCICVCVWLCIWVSVSVSVWHAFNCLRQASF